MHGDDFLVLAEDDQLTWMDGVLNSKYTARWEATVGDGELDGKEMFFLNRLIRYVADGTDGKRLEVEADARHAEILMRSFGFDSKTKGSDIPEGKIRDQDIIVEERSETLDEAQTGEFRSMTMRLAYLSQDRPDVIHASRTLASAMKSPKMGDWLRLKKVARYLLKYPYMKRTFLEQRPEDGLVRFGLGRRPEDEEEYHGIGGEDWASHGADQSRGAEGGGAELCRE